MNRRDFLSGMAIAVMAPPLAAQEPPGGKPARIGILSLRRPGVANPLTEALMQALGERGYVEGRNLVIEYPDARGREDRLPEVAADLVRKKVDVILILGPAPLQAAARRRRPSRWS